MVIASPLETVTFKIPQHHTLLGTGCFPVSVVLEEHNPGPQSLSLQKPCPKLEFLEMHHREQDRLTCPNHGSP